MNTDAKTLNKILVNQIKPYFKRIIHHDDQVKFIPGAQGELKHLQINVIHHINEIEDKNHIVISNAEKSSLTLCDPMDCSPLGFSVHRIF